MISTKKVLGSLFIVGFIAMNFLIGNHPNLEEGSFTLQNLEALQASATEVFCNPVNENDCKVTAYDSNGNPNGTAESKGIATIIY